MDIPTTATVRAARESSAAESRVVSEVVALEVVTGLESVFSRLDEALVGHGVSEHKIAAALARWGLDEAYLLGWCGRPALDPALTRVERNAVRIARVNGETQRRDGEGSR